MTEKLLHPINQNIADSAKPFLQRFDDLR